MFLKILGILFLVLICLIVLAIILFKLWLRKISGGQLNNFAEIKVEVDPDPKWIEEKKIKPLFDEFKALGFEPTFTLKPIFGSARTQFFTNKDRTIHASIAKIGSLITQEFSADTVEGMNLNVTNFERTDLFVKKAHKIIKGCPNASINQIYHEFLALAADSPLKSIPDELFLADLEAALKRDQQTGFHDGSHPIWEKDREYFIKRWQNHIPGENPSRVYAELVCQSLEVISMEIHEQLRNSEQISAKMFNQYDSCLICCNPDFDRWGFTFYLESLGVITPEELKNIEAQGNSLADSNEILTYVSNTKPELQLTKLCQLESPVSVDIFGYSNPEEDDD